MMMKPSGENVQLLRKREKKVSLMKMCEQLSSMNTKEVKKTEEVFFVTKLNSKDAR